jgi:hypothetical protein
MAERTIYQRFTVFSLLVSVLLSGCGYDRFDGLQPSDNQFIEANIGIGTLREWYGNDARVKHVYDDLVIAGWVTAEDKSDNFYRSFLLQDLSGTIEIRAGIYDLHTIFVRGRQVMIRLKNLDIDIYNGVLQLGRERESMLDFITARYIPGEYFLPQTNRHEVSPRKLSVSALTDEICGRLVTVSGLQSLDTEPVTWAGERIFHDGTGVEIAVETSPYAKFAGEKIPTGMVKLTGILTKKSTRYVLKIRDLDDVKTVYQ